MKKKQVVILVLLILLPNIDLLSQRIITVDFAKVKGPMCRNYETCIGAGRANEGLRADWQEQLLKLKSDVDFKYIRFHGLLHDDMGLYQEDKSGVISYNYQYVDALFDFLLKIKIRPFVELSFMPEKLSSDNKTFMWWKANITPPNNYDKWRNMIFNLVRHLEERYGKEEIEKWYFEVWNEPNLHSFWTGTQNDYYKLYEATAKTIKQVNSKYNVGGPATAGGGWIVEFLDYCYDKHIPIDFVSTHMYPLEGFVDATGHSKTKINPNPDKLKHDVDNVTDMVKNSHFSNLPVFFTEWSSSWSFKDGIHDSYQNAPYILNVIKTNQEKVKALSYWTFTDIFEEGGALSPSFHGGFGLMNIQGIPKPSYFAYKYLNQLGNSELFNDDQFSWVCKDGNNIQSLIFDLTMPQMKNNESDQDYFSQKHPSQFKENVQLTINNVPVGYYYMEIYKTGYNENDAFSKWCDLNKPLSLNIQTTRALKALSSDTSIEKTIIHNQDGILKCNFRMNDNDIYMIKYIHLDKRQ